MAGLRLPACRHVATSPPSLLGRSIYSFCLVHRTVRKTVSLRCVVMNKTENNPSPTISTLAHLLKGVSGVSGAAFFVIFQLPTIEHKSEQDQEIC